MVNLTSIMERRWWWGGPRDFWLGNIAAIKQVVDGNKLVPIAPELTTGPMLIARIGTEPQLPVPHRVPFPGGLKLPHLHYEGNAYLLTEEQWRGFTGRVLEDFKARLAKVKVVSFDQLMSIAETIDDVHPL